MPTRCLATVSHSAPSVGARERGTVHSIESARRRNNRPVAADAIGVVIVGSQAITRAGLRRLLEDEPGLAVLGEAVSARDAAGLARFTGADVILLDAGVLEPEPATSTRLLASRGAVLLLTECDPDDRVLAAIRAGATGVLPKDSHPADLASAVRTLAAGGALLPPRTTRRLIAELVNKAPSAPR